MFGYVIPYRDELKLKDIKRYKAYYCTICNQLRKRYGRMATAFLSYEMVFTLILLDSFSDMGKNTSVSLSCQFDLDLYYKSRHNSALSVTINYTQKRRSLMAANNHTKYDEDFKKSLVSLHQNGKTQSQLCKEYGVSQSALGKWVKQYSTVEMDDGDVLTAKQVKELQKRNAQLEEENLILKKAIAIFTPHSNND